MSVPIVLVHGLFGSQRDPEIIKAFGSRQVFAPDLIGYGSLQEWPTENLTLDDQAEHVIAFIEKHKLGKVHLVGHSIGGAIAALAAIKHHEKLVSLTTVEGNLTLKDAFWSKALSLKSFEEVTRIFAQYGTDPRAWFADAGVSSTPWSDNLAQSWLKNQPASTIKAQATAVVATTEDPSYLTELQSLMQSQFPVNLIAGERASEGWDTPVWANQYCSMRINIPNVGHLMMAEDPASYAEAVIACVTHSEKILGV